MKEQSFDRLFKWIDTARWLIWGLLMGAVALAVWATKIQMAQIDIEKRINDMQQNSSIHRDALKEREIHYEHRFTDIETNIEWLKKRE